MPHEVHQGLSLDINVIQRYRKIVLRNKEFRSWSNMSPKKVISQNTPDILSSFNVWTRTSGVSFFFRFLPEVTRVAHSAVDNGFRSCDVLPVLHGKTNSLIVSLLHVHLFFDLTLFMRTSDSGIVLGSSVSTINRSPVRLPPGVQGVSHGYSKKDFRAELIHLTLVFCWYWMEFNFCAKRNTRVLQKVN